MTLLCVAPGCAILGEHSVRCPDDPANGGEGVGACAGCLPTLATHGHLCDFHFDRLGTLYQAYQEWKALVQGADGSRLVAADGKSTVPDGWANLSPQFLAIDACERLLASRTGTLNRWVESEAGAADSLRFTAAAAQAIRLQVEEHKPMIVRERCPHCGLVTVRGHITVEKHRHTIVQCEWCREEITRVDKLTERWVGSETCESHDHLDCERVACRCVCHTIGRGSTGISALWDADQHTQGFVDRTSWHIDGHLIWEAENERKTA
ncbi:MULTISPECIES: hypothetical protein [unclassified Microbacterium]|uniref:hypothetical protein n=1 Tax=unclassified Microbacterium TaxID=2609290 RepID=UPI003015BE36